MIINEYIIHYLFSFLNACVQIGIVFYIYRKHLYPTMVKLYQQHQEKYVKLAHLKEQVDSNYAVLNKIFTNEKKVYGTIQDRIVVWQQKVNECARIHTLAFDAQMSESMLRRKKQINAIELSRIRKNITSRVRTNVERNVEIYFNNPEAVNRYMHNVINALPKESHNESC